jgi:hypothetical protein
MMFVRRDLDMVQFQVGTGASTLADGAAAVREAWSQVTAKVPAPSLVVISTTVDYDLHAVQRTLAELAGDARLLGGTSCGGVLTDGGFWGGDHGALAVFAISDEVGDYGVGAAPLGDDPRDAARTAIKAALADAGCEGQMPAAVWLVTSPGGEEEVVLGIADVVGDQVPLIGGSAADNTIQGNWRQIVRDGVKEGHVVVAVLFPSTGIAIKTSFHSGYDPSEHKGTITAADDRVVREIDGKPAAQVYDAWTHGSISDVVAEGGGEVLSKTTLWPLGRAVSQVSGVPYFVLSHPERVLPDGSLRLFTDVAVGDELICMTGSVQNLVDRAGNVARSALRIANVRPEHARAALVIFCGGCFLTVRDRIGEVHERLRDALHGVPFLVTFTFGEQGQIVGAGNKHGNLMIATLAFVEESL